MKYWLNFEKYFFLILNNYYFELMIIIRVMQIIIFTEVKYLSQLNTNNN